MDEKTLLILDFAKAQEMCREGSDVLAGFDALLKAHEPSVLALDAKTALFGNSQDKCVESKARSVEWVEMTRDGQMVFVCTWLPLHTNEEAAVRKFYCSRSELKHHPRGLDPDKNGQVAIHDGINGSYEYKAYNN